MAIASTSIFVPVVGLQASSPDGWWSFSNLHIHDDSDQIVLCRPHSPRIMSVTLDSSGVGLYSNHLPSQRLFGRRYIRDFKYWKRCLQAVIPRAALPGAQKTTAELRRSSASYISRVCFIFVRRLIPASISPTEWKPLAAQATALREPRLRLHRRGSSLLGLLHLLPSLNPLILRPWNLKAHSQIAGRFIQSASILHAFRCLRGLSPHLVY
ncbi:uncharacterized protein C8Q71DRAFT_136464 [Rhodofomes roseus]|uniref:Uncharacterized protein n=1 Tax=Rhodofomes roseus TaxID=34475 RepID=A0ABQ8KBX2_9APHY|nr:uncharacterized protein C8Q71DRAFT_136464 [Rhodofomes roseus]KAH9835008.1 hypothetical protein C8Q71DRAFT_136464 [Rhodofomes roseus]